MNDLFRNGDRAAGELNCLDHLENISWGVRRLYLLSSLSTLFPMGDSRNSGLDSMFTTEWGLSAWKTFSVTFRWCCWIVLLALPLMTVELELLRPLEEPFISNAGKIFSSVNWKGFRYIVNVRLCIGGIAYLCHVQFIFAPADLTQPNPQGICHGRYKVWGRKDARTASKT